MSSGNLNSEMMEVYLQGQIGSDTNAYIPRTEGEHRMHGTALQGHEAKLKKMVIGRTPFL